MDTVKTITCDGIFWRHFGFEQNIHRVPVVILHGLFGSGDNWRFHAQELSKSRQVLVPDIPNHGRSCFVNNHKHEYIAQKIWDSLVQMKLNISPVVILGHSMGGKIAMSMALNRPDMCASLVIADIAPKPYAPRHNEIFEALQAVLDAGISSRKEADEIMQHYIPEVYVRAFLLKSFLISQNADESGKWQFNVQGLYHGYTDICGWNPSTQVYTKKALFIAGGDSPYMQDVDETLLRKNFPDASIETILHVGHWLHVEAREEFMKLLNAFVT